MSDWVENIINIIKLIEAESYTKGYSAGYEKALNDFMNTDYLKIFDKKKDDTDDYL